MMNLRVGFVAIAGESVLQRVAFPRECLCTVVKKSGMAIAFNLSHVQVLQSTIQCVNGSLQYGMLPYIDWIE
jgi:hypothetical protein